MIASAVRYGDLVQSYEEYKRIQIEACSFECANPRWHEGQGRVLDFLTCGVDRQTPVADIACGDGGGLFHLRRLGFTNVVGVDLHPAKAARAEQFAYPVVVSDMHHLNGIPSRSIGVVYSSHTLEHAYNPSQVISEFRRILKPDGLLLVVLPYVDAGTDNDRVHGAKYEIGINIPDEGRSVVQFFARCGLVAGDVRFDDFREPEVWLTLHAG